MNDQLPALPPQPISPLDGRYRAAVSALGDHLSEAGLNRARVHVEVEWLIYLTSHGNPDGVVFGRNMLSPDAVKILLDNACGTRPTVVVISACFSGVFVPVLAGPDRMIVTAARPDRASFGCGAEEVYTYFDGCVLESLPKAARFDVLAELARACVARRETEMGMTPPSEPQISIGAEMARRLPALTLVARPPG